MRRQFIIPDGDIAFLENHGGNWETFMDKGMYWLLVHQHEVPEGYNLKFVNILIKMETGYPRTCLDMAYFYPRLCLSNLKPINATFEQYIDGKYYQRWSRHRTMANQWRPMEDDLSAHFSLINFWLEQELIKA